MSYSSQGIPKSANTRREERTVTFVFRQSATQVQLKDFYLVIIAKLLIWLESSHV